MGFLGILMLDTRFPRPPGDIGNPVTFEALGIPARRLVVGGAFPAEVVRGRDPALIAPFLAAAHRLVAGGAVMITTSCGFLARHQRALAESLPVPVVTSSLLQARALPSPGILTIDADALDAALLEAAGVPAGTPVEGVAPGCEFQRRILGNERRMDLDAARSDVVGAALALQARAPSIGSVLLECTNMPPYRAAIAEACRLPVHDIVTLLAAEWARAAVRAGSRGESR